MQGIFFALLQSGDLVLLGHQANKIARRISLLPDWLVLDSPNITDLPSTNWHTGPARPEDPGRGVC